MHFIFARINDLHLIFAKSSKGEVLVVVVFNDKARANVGLPPFHKPFVRNPNEALSKPMKSVQCEGDGLKQKEAGQASRIVTL